MRRYITFLLILPLTILIGCSENSVDNTKEVSSLKELTAKYKYVGEDHNAGMQSIVESINNTGHINSRKEIMRLVEKSGTNFIEELSSSDVQTQQNKKRFINHLEIIKKRSKSTSLKSSRPYKQIFSSNKLSSTQKKLIKDIRHVLSANSDLLVIKNKLDSINQEASQKINNKEELEVIIMATTVAKSSIAYWNENLDKWTEAVIEVNGENSKLSSNQISNAVDPGAIADADVEGAVAGAVGSVILGCAELTGGACLAAGATVGGVGNSAGKAVTELIDYFW